MNNGLFTVTAFTIRNKMKSKAFLVTTIIIALILSVVINLPYIISKFSSDGPVKVGAVETDTAVPKLLEQYFAAQKDPSIEMVLYKDQGSKEANEQYAKDKIDAKEIKGYLEFHDDPAAGFPKVTYKSKGTFNMGTQGNLQTALQTVKTETVARDILSKEQLAKIQAPVILDHLQISTTSGGAGSVGSGKTQEEINLATGLVYVLIIFLFMGTMISGQLIATEITAEKSSRVMEILITSVSPLKQMFGKILGMFVVAISQIILFVGVALLNLNMPQNVGQLKGLNINLSDIDPALLVYAVLFYLMGFFLYSTLFAAVGSIVSRTEDLGQAIMPITFLSMAGFYIAIFGLSSPTSTFVTAMSFVPFFTPFIMFLRLGLTDPPLWEVLVSIGLLAAAIFLLGWLSARIYRVGVLMYGKRPSWKEIRKAMKAF